MKFTRVIDGVELTVHYYIEGSDYSRAEPTIDAVMHKGEDIKYLLSETVIVQLTESMGTDMFEGEWNYKEDTYE